MHNSVKDEKTGRETKQSEKKKEFTAFVISWL